ncbi:MAG: NUDIX hydrolase [Muribaculaceae bacterium]|nr:NUDIX hydrolase [Muribaculaceae bacterium]
MKDKKPKNSYQDQSGQFCYRYPRAAITSDSVIFGFDGNELKILLVERGVEPFKGMWALPGGFMKMDESIEQCAARELREETNISNVYLEQFEVFSRPDRDPRGRVVTVAFIALVRPSDYEVIAGDDAALAVWFSASMLPPLAFDHKEIIDKACIRLREILRVRPVAFRLLEDIFTVDELRKVYEAVNGTTYDRRNFQRKLMASQIVEPISAISDCVSCDCNGLSVERATAPSPRSPGRKASKLLRLKNKCFSKNSSLDSFGLPDLKESSSDDSIKDLFNF